MIVRTASEPPDERAAGLANLLRAMPGKGSAVQCHRLLTAMQKPGSLTGYEGARYLDCYDPRARVYELQLAGRRNKTVSQSMLKGSGVLHYAGVYMLDGLASDLLLDGLDQAEVST